MYRIRDKPRSAKPTRSPAAHKVPEDNSWNNSVRGEVLQNYDSKSDKHCLGFFNMRKSYKKQRLKLITSVRSKNSSNKDSRSASAHKADLTLEQIEILKEELELTWQKFQIPAQHRSLFISSLTNIPKTHSAVKIAREIDAIEKGDSNILSVMQAVADREKFLKEAIEKMKGVNGKVEVVAFARVIDKLRDVTLRAIECIFIWRSGFYVDVEFEWQGIKYFEKLRTDSDVFIEGPLSRYYSFCRADPLFTGPVAPKTVNKKAYSIPFAHKQSARVHKALESLGFTPIKPSKQLSETQISEIPRQTTENLYSEPPAFFATEILAEENPMKNDIPEISKLLFEDLIESNILIKISEFVIECFNEIISASLTLYSSSILDRVITEVLTGLIPAIAKESHTEVTDSEYIDIRNLIINEVMEEQIEFISSIQTNNILSVVVTEEVVGCIELFQITLQTIQEEVKENQSIVDIAADELIEEFFREEWMEEIAEVELVQEKMEAVWLDLPAHIQREIYTFQKANIIERIVEMVYFGVLNDIIARLWLEGFVKSIVKECLGDGETPDEEIFVLRDPNVVIDEGRKATLYRNIKKK